MAALQIAALGRPFKLGMLYDCRKETLVPGIALWDSSILDKKSTQVQKYSEFNFITNDDTENKGLVLDINANLKLSLMSGMIDASGSAKFFHDRKSSTHQVRVTLDYKCKTKFESLTMELLAKGKFQHPEVFSSDMATHVVTGIQYGGHAFLLFDKEHSDSNSKTDVEGSVKALIEKIPMVSIEGDAKIELTASDKLQAESLRVKLYGDFVSDTTPTTFLDAVNMYKKLPGLLGNPENSVPLVVYLHPLCDLDSRASRLVREINASLVNEITAILEQLHEYETRCSDLMKTPACKNFKGLEKKILRFKKMIGKYKTEFQRQLLPIIPKIRGGGSEESELTEIMKKKDNSPFQDKMLLCWLQEHKYQAKVLGMCLKNLGGVDFAQTKGDLRAVYLNPNNRNVVCFTIRRPAKDSYLLSMESCLQNPDFKFQDEPTTIYIDESLHNSRKFIEYFRSNKDKSTKFIITEEETGDSDCIGGSIYLYEDGRLVNRNFEPPSEQDKPNVRILNCFLSFCN